MKYAEARKLVDAAYPGAKAVKLDTSLYAIYSGRNAVSGAADSISEAWIDAAILSEERKALQNVKTH